MAIGLTGSPQQLTPGYNPVYWYADSPNSGLESYRYLFKVTNFSDGVELADLKIKPRYGDSLMEVNISKILGSNLGVSSDDFNLNGDILAFNDTASSGFRYSIELGEEYMYSWAFDDTNFSAGKVRLVSTTESNYNVGDSIDVRDASQYFNFTDNQFSSGEVGFLTVDDLSAIINIGDTLRVEQSPGFTYPQYNTSLEVTSVSSTLITLDFPFQGSTPPQGGRLIRNFYYDGLAIVSETGTSGGLFYIEYDEPWVDSTNTHPGTVVYSDGRVTSNPSIFEKDDNYVFNGASEHKNWISWNGLDYDPREDPQDFLTNLPYDWTVSLENDIFLNNWSLATNDTFNSEMVLRTYDSGGTIIDTFSFDNNFPYTEIQAIPMGPRGLNRIYPNIIQNGMFQSTSNWAISDFLSSTNISGGNLNFTDPDGDGEAIVVQAGALTIGCEYKVTITSSSNSGVIVRVGDNSTDFTIVSTGDDGTFTVNFTATSTNFFITIASGILSATSVILDNVMVQQLCPIIHCDVNNYTINIYDKFGVTQSMTRNFNLDCLCEGRYVNYPILFMDRFGSLIPFDFSLNNKQNVNINRDKYNKFIGNLNNNGSYAYDTTEHSRRDYNIDLEEQWELNTNYMTVAESIFFEQLVTSPIAFILIDDEYQAVNITDKKYERKNKTTKLRRYSINIEFSNNNTINI